MQGEEPYESSNGSQAAGFGKFAGDIEDMFQRELDTYVTEVVAEKHQSGSS